MMWETFWVADFAKLLSILNSLALRVIVASRSRQMLDESAVNTRRRILGLV